jgi:hypothetical protein
MAEQQLVVQEDDDQPVFWMSFCPELGIYHHHREVDGEDPADAKFTREELVDMVEALMRASKAAEARQLADLCAWARLFAHKIVVFYVSGTFKIFNPIPSDDEEKAESEDMKQFFAEWKQQHPTSDTVPTVAAYKSVKPVFGG